MMRTFYILSLVMAITLLLGATFDENYEDCVLRCSAERDTRNMDCPSPFDASDDERNQCLRDSKEEYDNCISDCPAPSSTSPSSE